MKLFDKIMAAYLDMDAIKDICDKYEKYFTKAEFDIDSLDFDPLEMDATDEEEVAYTLSYILINTLIKEGWFTAEVDPFGFDIVGENCDYIVEEDDEKSDPDFRKKLQSDVDNIREKIGFEIEIV